jgi:4'-phosphopantetheinyl transferase
MKILIFNTQHVLLKDLIPLLPISLQARATTYRSEPAAINYCVGRLMLKKAVEEMGFSAEKILELTYSARKKPLLGGCFFNISHSGTWVALAYSLTDNMGLDIECPQNVHLPHFRASFREDEWEDIINNEDAKARFYWYWVRKEAILKAVDLPLSELKKIRILNDLLGDTGENTERWQLQGFFGGENCLGMLAAAKQVTDIDVFTL